MLYDETQSTRLDNEVLKDYIEEFKERYADTFAIGRQLHLAYQVVVGDLHGGLVSLKKSQSPSSACGPTI